MNKIICLYFLFLNFPLFGYSPYGVEKDRNYQSAESEHFKIHFPQDMENHFRIRHKNIITHQLYFFP